MKEKTTFVFNVSFGEAESQAKLSGYNIIGRVRNPRGQFVVFARRMRF